MRVDATHFITEQYPVRTVITSAFNIELWALKGAPDWTASEGYNITATMPAGTSNDDLRAMIRRLLGERCKLVTHRETKETSVYALVVAKGGPKLKATAEGTKYGVQRRAGHLETHRTSIANFVRSLGELDRPILDMTGIQGQFDITLDWSAETGPSIFTAIEEQSGLRLEARKVPIEYVVIDSIERPSGN
jgi:uncharacterized protein (TIGR03435 family)